MFGAGRRSLAMFCARTEAGTVTSRPTPEPDTQDHFDHYGPVGECPDCGARDFLLDDSSQEVVFQCLECLSRWRYELGYTWRVHPDRPPTP